jgi:N utilization substance protein B
MISRRNIRSKVMQVLYMAETSHLETPPAELEEILSKSLDKTRELFVYLLYFITEVALYAETDSRHRRSKNLPSREDLDVNTKISTNLTILAILDNQFFRESTKEFKTELLMDPELLKKMYNALKESPAYQQYIQDPTHEKSKDREIVRILFSQILLPNELFCQQTEEHFNNWDDDGEMMEQLVLNYIQKPGVYNTKELLSQEKWNFARELLRTVGEKRELCSSLINPKLKNWDAERIAVLDMILMRMGLCELLFFDTIPTKVTLNEYIDLAKTYSTQQSGQFVNGILDNIHKELVQEGKITKKDFKSPAA